MDFRLLLILFLKFEVSLSVPTLTEKIAEVFRFSFNESRFFYNSCGGVQHYFLDIFYVEYFSEDYFERRKRIKEKISIYTHIYLLERKLQQNEEKLRMVHGQVLSNGNSLVQSVHGTVNVYEKLLESLSRPVLNHKHFAVFAMSPVAVRELCYLLGIKHDLMRALNYDSKINLVEQKPACYDLEIARESVHERGEQLSEWILCDLMMFFPKRQRLTKYFEELYKKESIEEIELVWAKFRDLLGFARVAMLCSTYFNHLGLFVSISSSNVFFAFFYREYFKHKTDNVKWRTKIVLQKFLYDEWANKLFHEETSKIIMNSDVNVLDVQLNFISDMKHLWSLYSKNFWLHEKTLRALIEKLAKQNWRKASKAIEILSEHRKKIFEIEWKNEHDDEKNLMHLFENGPVDTSLFRALALCVPTALVEYGNSFGRQRQKIEKMNKLSQFVQIKMLLCVGKHLNSVFRSDEIVAKLHFNKMAKLFDDESGELNDDEFRKILTDNQQFWGELLDSESVKRLKELLNYEIKYLSTTENFSSSEEESFKDANSDEETAEPNLNLEHNEEIVKENASEIAETKSDNFEINNLLEEQNIENKWQKKAKNKQKNYNRKRLKKSKKEIENENEIKSIGENNGNIEEVKDQKRMQKAENSCVKRRGENETMSKNRNNPKKKDDAKSEIIKICSVEKTKNICVEILKQLDMEKYSDLLNDKYLANFYKIFLKNELVEKCIVYLHVAAFVRTICCKLKFIKIRTKNRDNKILRHFDEKWRFFESNKLSKIEEIKFILEKLNFVDIELNELAFGPIEQKHIKKAIHILDEIQMKKVKKNVNKNNEKLYEEEDFGVANKLNKTLNQLHLQILGILIAKKFIPIKANKLNSNANTDTKTLVMQKLKMLLSCDEKANYKFLTKYVSEMEAMLKQQKLSKKFNRLWTSIYERSQYKLIRNSPGSLKSDLKMAKEIIAFIQPYSIKPKRRAQISELSSQIEQIVQDWIQNIPATSNDKTPTKAKMLRNGSFLMNSELDGSDLDLICVVPEEIKFHYFFHRCNEDNLFSLLNKKLLEAVVSWRPGKVPLIRIEYGQILVDLLFVPVPGKTLLNDQNLKRLESDELIKEMSTEKGIYSLAGYRSGKYQLALVQNQNNLSFLLRTLKVWAKNRFIYSGLFGYFNGITLSIMATKICVLFPNAPLAYLLFQFFSIYSKWNWPSDQIMLKELTPETMNNVVCSWPPVFKQGECSMIVMTPTFPEQNAAYNVNTVTLRAIVQEFKIANEILADNPQNWKAIFAEIKIEEKFEHFALIVCSAFDFKLHTKNCAFEKSKIRLKLFEWANLKIVSAQLDIYHLIPKFEKKTICKITNKTFCTLWLVGLSMKAEFRENKTLEELLPIYSNNSSSRGHFLMRSFYTETQNLNKTIEELSHKNEGFEENQQNKHC